MLEIPYHKNFSLNQEKAGDGIPCVVCGRRVDNPDAPYIHTWYGTHCVTEHEADSMIDPERAGDSGCYPIGPDCLRKHPELTSYIQRGS